MPTSRTQHTVRNMIWGFARRFVALLGPFIVRMLLIQRLGADYLGLSTLYTSLLQILNIAELGFSTAVSYGMYAPLAHGDEGAVVRYLHYLRHVYRIVGCVILALGFAVMPFLGVLISGPVPLDVNIAVAFFIFLANTALGYLLFAHKQTLLVACQRKDVVDKAYLVVLIVQFALQAVLLVCAPNFYTYALVLPLTTIAANFVLAHMSDRLFPQYCDSAIRATSLQEEERSIMRKQIAGLVLQKACMLTRDPLAAVFISAFVGLGAVAQFGNYFVVVSGVLAILGVFGASMTASVGNSIALETPEKNYTDLRLFMFMYALISVVAAAILAALFQPFMALWVGEAFVLPSVFAATMVLYFYVRTMGDMRTVYVDATGVWWALRWRALAETFANIVLCAVFTYFWGLQGAIVALCLSLFVFNFLYGSHLVFKLYFGMQYVRSYYLDHALYAAAAVLVCLLTFGFCSFVPASSVVQFLLRGLCATLIAGGSCLILFWRAPLFKQARGFLQLMKGRR